MTLAKRSAQRGCCGNAISRLLDKTNSDDKFLSSDAPFYSAAWGVVSKGQTLIRPGRSSLLPTREPLRISDEFMSGNAFLINPTTIERHDDRGYRKLTDPELLFFAPDIRERRSPLG